MNKLIREQFQQGRPPIDPTAGYDVLLYANELPANPSFALISPEEREEITAAAFNRYPDCAAVSLRTAYAAYLDAQKVAMGNVAAGNGSDELIRLIGEIYLDIGDTVVSCEPAFGAYQSAAIRSRARYIGLHSDDEYLRPSVDAVIETANREDAKMIFLCTPHNPTGYLWEDRDIDRVITETKGMVILDEAYMEFSGQKGGWEKAISCSRVLVLRTLSKAFGLAGCRIGFVVGTQENIDAFNRAKDLYNLNTFSQLIGEALLKKSTQLDGYVKTIIRQRDYVFSELSSIDSLIPFPSSANFICVRTASPEKAKEFYETAGSDSILIRRYQNEPLFRVTIGTEQENNRMLAAFRKAAGE